MSRAFWAIGVIYSPTLPPVAVTQRFFLGSYDHGQRRAGGPFKLDVFLGQVGHGCNYFGIALDEPRKAWTSLTDLGVLGQEGLVFLGGGLAVMVVCWVRKLPGK